MPQLSFSSACLKCYAAGAKSSGKGINLNRVQYRRRHAKTEWYTPGAIHLGSDSLQEQRISGYHTSHMRSDTDSQMPYRNLLFFKHLNMKTLLKEYKYDPAILKTSDLSIGIIGSSPQSRETIPLTTFLCHERRIQFNMEQSDNFSFFEIRNKNEH